MYIYVYIYVYIYIYIIYIIYIYNIYNIYIYIGLCSRSGRSRILMAFEILEFFDLKM